MTTEKNTVLSSAGVVEPWAAAVIGIIGGVLCERTKALLLRLKLDDVVNAVGMHFLPGVWGTLACGFFANNRIRDIYSLPTCARSTPALLGTSVLVCRNAAPVSNAASVRNLHQGYQVP